MTAVFFISHIFNDFTLFQYESIKKSLLDGFDLIWISNENKPDNLSNDIKYSKVEITHDPNNFNLVNGSCFFKNAYILFPSYDFYWFIEYDVCINNKENSFKKIFYYYTNYGPMKSADIICDHLSTYNTHQIYDIRYNYDKLVQQYGIDKNAIPKRYVMFGFFTICRFSNRFLKLFNSHPEFHNYYVEWAIPTLGNISNAQFATLHNMFSYDTYYGNALSINPQEFNNIINHGTNAWNKANLGCVPIFPKESIIHPIKSYDDYNKYVAPFNK